MEEFLASIGITAQGEYTDNNTYVIDINNSNEYGKYYSRLERCGLIEQDDESSSISLEASSIQFINDEYTITLLGDLENDAYKLTIREN